MSAVWEECQIQRFALNKKIGEIQAAIQDKQYSPSVLAGALLQIGKQRISIVKGCPENCPDGRIIYGIPFKLAIWTARNQAIHFEEPRRIGEETESVFQTMVTNGALSVIELLE
jgi:hypothetical protein